MCHSLLSITCSTSMFFLLAHEQDFAKTLTKICQGLLAMFFNYALKNFPLTLNAMIMIRSNSLTG